MSDFIVDFRCRPVSLHPFYGAQGVTPERIARLEWMNSRVGSEDPRHLFRVASDEALEKELEAAGIDGAVVIGRHVRGIEVPNELIASWNRKPGYVGIGSVSVEGTARESVEQVEEIRRLGLYGVNMDPGFSARRLHVDDAELYPVYEACDALGLPVFLMSGPNTGPTLDYTNPDRYAAVARDFPTLNVVVGHGAWPFVDEMIGAAFRYENLFVSPDIYFNMAGAMDRYRAATLRGPLRHQLVFATGFPFRAIDQTTREFVDQDWGDAREDLLWRNGQRLLGCDLKEALASTTGRASEQERL